MSILDDLINGLIGTPTPIPQDEPIQKYSGFNIAQAPPPKPLTAFEKQQLRTAITSGGLTDLAGIFLGQAPQGRSGAALQKLAFAERGIEDQARETAQFNAGQENQFGKAAFNRDAALERLRIQELGKTNRVQLKGGKVRVLQEADSTGNPVNVAYQEVTDANGQMYLQRVVIQQGENTQTSTAKPIHYQTIPTEGGGATRVATTGTGGNAQAVTGPGGSPLMRQPTQGQITQVASDVTTLRGIDEIWKGYKDLHDSTGGDQPLFSMETGKRILATEAGGTKYGGKIAPKHNIYITKRRLGLNRYIKGVTGAQFSIKELERYEAMFPQSTDDESTAKQKLSDIAEQAQADMDALISAHGGLARMKNDPTQAWRFGPEGAPNPPTSAGQRIPSPPPPPAGTRPKTPKEILDELDKKHGL